MTKRTLLPIVGIVATLLLFFAGAMFLELSAHEQRAAKMAQSVAQNLSRMLKNEIEKLITLPALLDTIDDQRRYRYLDELVRLRLQDAGLAKVKFYNAKGILIYAEKQELIGQDHSAKVILQQALSGQFASKIVGSKEYEDAYGTKQKTSLIETYMPIVDSHGEIRYVMEVYQNFDPIRAEIYEDLWRDGRHLGLLAIVACMIIIYLLGKLQRVSKERDLLQSLLPICSFCKKIRNDDLAGGEENAEGRWVQLEQYLMEHQAIEFSHGLCEECLEIHYPDTKKRNALEKAVTESLAGSKGPKAS